ncbi:MAG: toxin ParE1/3/4 [Verrucomicrobiota bacterium]
MKRIIVRQDVESDLIRYVRHLANDKPKVGEDFATAAETTFRQIAQFPSLGRLRRWRHPGMASVRSGVMPRPFGSWLVFYREMSDALEILRVLHAAWDLETRNT